MALDLSEQVAAANALDYVVTPFAAGIQAADYAAQHQAHGEVFRYWESATKLGSGNKSGEVFTEVELGDGKCLFYRAKKTVESAEFGLIPKGEQMVSILPSVVEVTRGARILRVAQAWRGRAIVTRGATDTDQLPERFIVSIASVTAPEGEPEGEVDLELDVSPVAGGSPNDDDLGGIQWLNNAPEAGTVYSVAFTYNPLFECLGESIEGQPVGTDGERLPQHVLLKKHRD